MSITLLTRDGCSACEAARADLSRICGDLSVEFDVVDVDVAANSGETELRAEYGDRLPVVLLDDEEHSYVCVGLPWRE